MNPIPRWSIARFPSHWLRESFREQLARWSRVEGLPTVEVEPLVDGRTIRFSVADADTRIVASLAWAYGAQLSD
jgi:hypothetical protein